MVSISLSLSLSLPRSSLAIHRLSAKRDMLPSATAIGVRRFEVMNRRRSPAEITTPSRTRSNRFAKPESADRIDSQSGCVLPVPLSLSHPTFVSLFTCRLDVRSRSDGAPSNVARCFVQHWPNVPPAERREANTSSSLPHLATARRRCPSPVG